MKRPFESCQSPTATTPQMPQAPCAGHAPTTSSTRQCISVNAAAMYTMPDIAPISSDHPGTMQSQLAVIATKPEMMPFDKPTTSSLPPCARVEATIIVERPPAAAESVVQSATFDATSACSPDDIAPVEPALKPYQPTHSMSVPQSTLDTLCGAKSTADVSSHRWSRGPKKVEPRSAASPPR
eukprot:6214399-Pleurochrysis_carterae.AAC.1